MLSVAEESREIAAPGTSRPPAREAGARRRRIGRRAEPYLYIAPTAILIGVLLVVPIATVIGYSLFDNVISDPDPRFVGLAHFADLLVDPRFHTSIRNTLVFTVTSVAAHLVLGLAFALLLDSRLLGRASIAIYRTIYVLPWLFTVAIVAVLWRLLLNPNGVVNHLLSFLGAGQIEWLADPSLALGAVTFVNIWAGYPFFMVSLLAGLQGIPSELYEAARVDGAGPWQRFTAVTLPQLRPIIVSMSLLDLIWTSQQFALIWMTTGGGPVDATELVSTFTYKLAFTRYEFGAASASAVIVLALSMVLAVFYARHQRRKD
ncbi:sugar ABC transporter permease [Microbacterium betulae]|uniref:Sugar ABC transporter permease n=1 Tax=Microbacterium betulae TaxID=2981139 RepID=A0AA97I610_9MICO|nr:sugar ABC transporter permease [Microbacterium sp. AB]WOF22065.1 sugar ABC transporter permease [Microbacterium sp. AB]